MLQAWLHAYAQQRHAIMASRHPDTHANAIINLAKTIRRFGHACHEHCM